MRHRSTDLPEGSWARPEGTRNEGQASFCPRAPGLRLRGHSWPHARPTHCRGHPAKRCYLTASNPRDEDVVVFLFLANSVYEGLITVSKKSLQWSKMTAVEPIASSGQANPCLLSATQCHPLLTHTGLIPAGQLLEVRVQTATSQALRVVCLGVRLPK